MKKIAAVLAMLYISLTLIPAGALASQQPAAQRKADGHSPGDKKPGQSQPHKHPTCGVKHCDQPNDHKHGDKWYGGHYIGDGHNWHKVCDIKDCNRQDVHKHGKTSYFPKKNIKHPGPGGKPPEK